MSDQETVSLLDEVHKTRAEKAAKRHQNTCKLVNVIESLSEKQQEEALLLLTGQYSAEDIRYALKSIGKPVGTTTIRYHRNGECACRTTTA